MKTTAIIGAGALGILFGEKLTRCYGKDAVCFAMDESRFAKHRSDIYQVNGTNIDFRLSSPADAKPVDLLIIATKFSGLEAAIRLASFYANENTTIISLLNGIISEQLLSAALGEERVLGCVALGMDATRNGTSLNYTSPGTLQLGTLHPGQHSRLNETVAMLQNAGIHVELHTDIQRALYAKFMLNVGVNQTCAVYNIPYGPVTGDPFYRGQMIAAMAEAVAVANAEGIDLTHEDLDRAVTLISTLGATLSPSMRQDVLAGRKTEVALFAGTVLDLAAKHGLDTPVNRFYYQKLTELEKAFT